MVLTWNDIDGCKYSFSPQKQKQIIFPRSKEQRMAALRMGICISHRDFNKHVTGIHFSSYTSWLPRASRRRKGVICYSNREAKRGFHWFTSCCKF